MSSPAQTKIRRLRREELPHDTVKLTRFLIGKVVVHDLACGRLSGRIVEAEAYPPGDPAGHHFRGPTPRIRSMYLHPGHAYVFFNYGAHFMLNVASEPEGVAGGILIRALEPLDGIEWMQQHRSANSRRSTLTDVSGLASEVISHKGAGKIARSAASKVTGNATHKIVHKEQMRLVDLTRGPGRVAAALQIDRRHDGIDLVGADSALWLGELVEEEGVPRSAASVARGGVPRSGTRAGRRKVARTVRIGISRAADKLLRFYERGNPFVSGPKRLLLPSKKKAMVLTRRQKNRAHGEH